MIDSVTLTTEYRFPFGQPVLARRLLITESRPYFVLGAYPSALHIHWCPPYPYKPVKAIAVDNEPEIFWDGRNEQVIFNMWKKTMKFDPSRGNIEPAKRLNGSSGKWVDEYVLSLFKISRQEAWLTDCLDTYRCSTGLAARLKDTYEPLALKCGWPTCNLLPHPDEDTIVSEALAYHRDRLNNELASAHPELVVTLGNAALRVFRELALEIPPEAPGKLSLLPGLYGSRIRVKLSTDRFIDWLPLVHPATPQRYRQAHEIWVKSLVK